MISDMYDQPIAELSSKRCRLENSSPSFSLEYSSWFCITTGLGVLAFKFVNTTSLISNPNLLFGNTAVLEESCNCFSNKRANGGGNLLLGCVECV